MKRGRVEHSIGRSVSLAGKGVFTGKQGKIILHPAPEGSGISFHRTDLSEAVPFYLNSDALIAAPFRCTALGNGQWEILTVEHLLSAIRALEIDNLRIEVEGPEIPILDGSARPFVELIQEAGILAQSLERTFYEITEPLFWEQDKTVLAALPSKELRISCTISYPDHVLVGTQFYSLAITPATFIQEIAPARTFCFYEEIAPLLAKGELAGGDLESGIVIGREEILNPDGLRYEDEMVRHKILDLWGDLASVPYLFTAHLIAICAGHQAHAAFARRLSHYLMSHYAEEAQRCC